MVQVNVFENTFDSRTFPYQLQRLSQIVLNILGNSIKNGFALVHISRFKQAIAIHTLQAFSQDVKVSTRLQICSKYNYKCNIEFLITEKNRIWTYV